MMKRYHVINPTGNITALVTTPTPAESRAETGALIMKKEPQVEQTGFFEAFDNSFVLNMAGGEFCGNATISAAALYCELNGLKNGGFELTAAVSGCAEALKVFVRAGGGSYVCTVNMPAANGIEQRRFTLGGREHILPVVTLPGITHIIVKDSDTGFSPEKSVKELCAALNAPALGIMSYDSERRFMTPLVYVPGADTLFFESSCASGSCALAALTASEEGREVTLGIKQPGGELTVFASPSGEIRLTGGAVIIRQGILQ